ncbi:M14 family zinc carboxypeptidase [Peribacillus alkalitolerans]|uniref:M14 family zinc carboxypeptidase n=1 Tax=Peribacillus alkalitolerans TaxID=1550385 RepID=UPI0013D80A41|nr:M14 family zinc carboxypeptidase [Peribacillus alkalitolerans]
MVFILLLLHPFMAHAQVVNTSQTYSYGDMTKDIKELMKKYPDALQVETIGKSHFGKDLWGVRIGKGEKTLLLIGAHHGREWFTTLMLMKILEVYGEAYQQRGSFEGYDSRELDVISIYIVPMLNPDGVSIQQGDFSGFDWKRKWNIYKLNGFLPKFTRWKANGIGVDLNRQYPAGWEGLDRDVTHPYYQFYRGKTPIFTKETRAIVDLTNKIDPLMAVAYHTSGQEIYWYYHNQPENIVRDYTIAKRTAELTGYKLDLPDEGAVGGGYTDWFITTFHRPALTLELCELIENRHPPLFQFEEEWHRNKLVPFMLLNEIGRISNDES